MIALIQRVHQARVEVDKKTTADINRGILAFIGIQKADTETAAKKLLEKILAYRIFPDEKGQMNLSLNNVKGELLLVSQFTLAANTQSGLRPSFSAAASPALAKQLFQFLVEEAREKQVAVKTGTFGADMQVSLVNDGPVTFWLETK